MPARVLKFESKQRREEKKVAERLGLDPSSQSLLEANGAISSQDVIKSLKGAFTTAELEQIKEELDRMDDDGEYGED